MFFFTPLCKILAMAKKNPAAVTLGRKGGKNSRKNLSDEEKRKLARKALEARWSKWRAEHPEKAAASEERRLKRSARKSAKKQSK